MKLIRKSTVKKNTGPICGQKGSDTVLPNGIPMRMFSRYVFLPRHVKISPCHKIKSSSFTTHKSVSQPQRELPRKQRGESYALREDFKRIQKNSQLPS